MDDSDTMIASSTGFVRYMNVVLVCYAFLRTIYIRSRYFCSRILLAVLGMPGGSEWMFW